MASTRRESPRHHFNTLAHAPAVAWDATPFPPDQGHDVSDESPAFQHRKMSSSSPVRETYRRQSMDCGSRGGTAGLRRHSRDEPAAAGRLHSVASPHGLQQEAHHHHGMTTTNPHHREQLREANHPSSGNTRPGDRTSSATHSNVARHRLSLDEPRPHPPSMPAFERSADHNHRRMSLDECRRPIKSSTGKALRPSTALYSDHKTVPMARSGRVKSETLIDSGAVSAPTSRRGSRTDTGQASSSRAGSMSKHASCMKVSGNIDSFIRGKGGTTSHRSFLHLSSDQNSRGQSDHTMDWSEWEDSLELPVVLPSHKSCPQPQLLAMLRNPSMTSDQGSASPDMSHGNSESEEGSNRGQKYGNSESEEGSGRGQKFSDEDGSFEEDAIPFDGDESMGQGQPPWRRSVLQSAVCRAAIRKQAKPQMTTKNSVHQAKPLKGKAAVRQEIDDFLIRMKGKNPGENYDDDEEASGDSGLSRRGVSSLARKNLFSRTEDGQTSKPSSRSGSGSGSTRKLQTSSAFRNMLKPNPHIKISDGRKIPLKELRGMLEEFKKHDTAGDGDVSLQKLGPAKNINAGVSQNGERMSMFNSNRVSRKSLEQAGVFRKSESFQRRIKDGKISFKDMIHIQYPTANEAELDIMVNETSRFQEMKLSDFSPTKVKKAQVLYRKIDAKGRADGVNIEVLEDYFLEHAPTSTDIYHVLQTIQPDAKERMYNKEGVLTEQEFIMWTLTFEMKTGHMFPLKM